MLEGALALLALVGLVSLPALCFVALFRFIDSVADDELIARVEAGEIGSGSPTGPEGATAPDPSAAIDAAPADETASCRACGVENWTESNYCWNCLSKLR